MFQSAHPGTLVTVNRRASRRLRRDYDLARRAAGATVWEAPDILPFDAWVARLWRERAARDPLHTPVVLNRAQEDALWHQAIRRDPSADQLLDAVSTAAMAARAWELLHAWELPHAAAAFAETSDCQAFFTWMSAVENQLNQHGWITASQLPGALTGATVLSAAPVSYTGFAEHSPRDARLLRRYHATETTTGTNTNSQVDQVAHVDERCERSSDDELLQAALWARAKLEQAAPPYSIAVMIPGLLNAASNLAAKAERIFDDVLHPSLQFVNSGQRLFHLSAGVASDEVPLISTALLLLGLQPGLSLADAGVLLRSPFLEFDRVRAAEVEARLRKRRATFVYLHDVESLLPGLAQQAEKMFQRETASHYPSRWSQLFSDLVSSAGWRRRSPQATERHAVEHWTALLSDLASLDLVLPQISYDKALAHLRRIARHHRFHPQEQDPHADAPVQIMDLHEGAGAVLPYDAIWIAGLHAGAWPEPARMNPFLPAALQKAAGVPGQAPEHNLQFAVTAMKRLKHSAPEVVLSYPRAEGEQELRPSPVLQTVRRAPSGSTHANTALRLIYEKATILDDLAAGRAAAPRQAGTAYHGGASLLEHQSACSFKAFAIHRLGARELEEAELGVSPRERGNAVHSALQLLWEQLRSQEALKDLSSSALESLIHACAQKAILDKSDAPERFQRLELNRLTRLLADWLQQERARPPFQLEQSEMDQQVPMGELLLKIRPDRVDRYADGSLAILDYKTGKKLSVEDWDGERPSAPQLPFYAVNATQHQHKVSEVMFVQLTGAKIKMHSRAGAELQHSLPEWQRILQRLAAEFAAGQALVNPKQGRKTCAWCRLESLCRVDELGVLGASDDAEESD